MRLESVDPPPSNHQCVILHHLIFSYEFEQILKMLIGQLINNDHEKLTNEGERFMPIGKESKHAITYFSKYL